MSRAGYRSRVARRVAARRHGLALSWLSFCLTDYGFGGAQALPKLRVSRTRLAQFHLSPELAVAL